MIHIPPDSFRLSEEFAKVACEQSCRFSRQQSEYDLWYVWSGEGEIVLNGAPQPVFKGCCLLFRPGDMTTGSQNPGKPLTVNYIHFSIDGMPEQIPTVYRIMKDAYVLESLLTRYVELLLGRWFGFEQEAQLILKQVMIHLLREDVRKEQDGVHKYSAYRSIFETANYIRLIPGFQHRSHELAKRAKLSPRYFSAKFKELFGEKLEAYIVRTRLERAEYLLRYSDMNVTEAAEALGYQNVYYFSKQFKQYRGINPSKIREKKRGDR